MRTIPEPQRNGIPLTIDLTNPIYAQILVFNFNKSNLDLRVKSEVTEARNPDPSANTTRLPEEPTMDDEPRIISETVELVGIQPPFDKLATMSLLQQPGWCMRQGSEDGAGSESVILNNGLKTIGPLFLPFLNSQTASLNLR